MKIFDGLDIEHRSWAELDELTFLVSKWYAHVDGMFHNSTKEGVVSYGYVKGHLDYMLGTTQTVPPAPTYDGIFAEYKTDSGYVYVTYDSRGTVWTVFHVEHVRPMRRIPASDSMSFQEGQWAAAIDAVNAA